MEKKRKIKICSKCNKLKIHFGLGMCSACLRKFKRQTNPSFYLGTCYSEMRRRVKTKDILRPNYYGKNICTKQEFIDKFLNDKTFLQLYNEWQKSNFKRKMSPSIDRINNKKDYELHNLHFIKQRENSCKDKKYITIICDNSTNLLYFFNSRKEASLFLNISEAFLCKLFKKNKEYKNYEFI